MLMDAAASSKVYSAQLRIDIKSTAAENVVELTDDFISLDNVKLYVRPDAALTLTRF